MPKVYQVLVMQLEPELFEWYEKTAASLKLGRRSFLERLKEMWEKQEQKGEEK